MASKWKPVALGVVAASVGAAAFGAVHYMFLAAQMPVGDFFGIGYDVLLPIILGVAGFALPVMFKVKGTAKDVLQFGGAAAIGFGIANYAGWVTPVVARARAPIARARAPVRAVRAAPVVTSPGPSVGAGAMLI
jgi:hypothetical protein